MVQSLNDSNFVEKTNEGVVLVDFWAPWCGPCRMQGPVIDALSEKYEGQVEFFSVNAEDKNLRGILLKEDIDGIPSMVFFRDGKMLDSLVGYKKADVLEALIKEIM